MRKPVRIITAVVVATLIGSGIYSATSASAGDDGATTLRLHERDARGVDLDLGEPGFGVGDTFTFRGKLFTAGKDGKRIGTSGGSCVVVGVSGASADTHCNATFRLKAGQIALQAFVTFTEEELVPFHVAVVGGTGRYRNAHGEAEISDRPDGTSDIVIRLS